MKSNVCEFYNTKLKILPPWNIFLKKKTVPHLVWNFLHFMHPEGLLPCLQKTVTCPFPMPNEPCSRIPILFLYFHSYHLNHAHVLSGLFFL